MFEGVRTISSVDVLCKEVAGAEQPRPDLDLKAFQQTRVPISGDLQLALLMCSKEGWAIFKSCGTIGLPSAADRHDTGQVVFYTIERLRGSGRVSWAIISFLIRIHLRCRLPQWCEAT